MNDIEDVDFCSDSQLGYERSRTKFAAGAGLKLDENYRFAHLPLVAPDHPDVIACRPSTEPGASYAMGRHARTFSVVLPIPHALLAASEAFLEIESALRSAPLAGKIAWSLLPRRQQKLHATICGGLGPMALLRERDRRSLAAIGPVSVELRGLFSGDVNVGRLYLRAYPEQRFGQNAFQSIQRALGRRETDLFVVGLYNLTDHLDAGEAAALAALLNTFWDRPLLRFEARELWLLGASDDLVLTGQVEDVIRLD